MDTVGISEIGHSRTLAALEAVFILEGDRLAREGNTGILHPFVDGLKVVDLETQMHGANVAIIVFRAAGFWLVILEQVEVEVLQVHVGVADEHLVETLDGSHARTPNGVDVLDLGAGQCFVEADSGVEIGYGDADMVGAVEADRGAEFRVVIARFSFSLGRERNSDRPNAR